MLLLLYTEFFKILIVSVTVIPPLFCSQAGCQYLKLTLAESIKI